MTSTTPDRTLDQTSTLREDKRRVPGEFDRVAHRYDLLCRLNPGYRSHLLRSARRLPLDAGARALDLCCGTGLSTAALVAAHPTARVTAVDASAEMLRVARGKSALAGVDWVQGDAMDVRAAGVTGPFDGILMAYGIRNVPDIDACLAQLRELLAPGGAICFHEYSVAGAALPRLVWRAVSTAVIVPLGRAVTGTGDIFTYLKRSVLAFDDVATFERRLWRAGFTQIRTEPMSGWQRGVVHSFTARRPR